MSRLTDINYLESLEDDIGKIQEEAGVIMTDAKYVYQTSMDLDNRLRDVNERLHKLINKLKEELSGGKSS